MNAGVWRSDSRLLRETMGGTGQHRSALLYCYAKETPPKLAAGAGCDAAEVALGLAVRYRDWRCGIAALRGGFGAQFGWWAQSGRWTRFQAMRCDTGIPSRVIRLSTAQPTRASVFWAGSVRARRPRPMRAL